MAKVNVSRAFRELFTAVVMPVAGQTHGFYCMINEDQYDAVHKRLSAVFLNSGVLKSEKEFSLSIIESTRNGNNFTAEMKLYINPSRTQQDLLKQAQLANALSTDQAAILKLLSSPPNP